LLGIETIIFVRGSFASGGYARFLVPICGLTAVVASCGLAAVVRAKAMAAACIFIVIAAAVFAYGSNDPYLIGRCWGQVVGAVEPTAGLGLPFRSAHQIRSAMMYLAGGFALFAVLAAVAEVFRSGRLGLAMRIVAIVVVAVAVIAEGAAFARPLTLESTPMNSLLARASRHEAVARYAGCAAIASHAVVSMIRPNTQLVLNFHEALQRWLASPPGTLLFWENKYCGTGMTTAGQDGLVAPLEHGGVMVVRLTRGDDVVEVYVRSQGPTSAP
jgi:hypothetical protein